MMLADFRVHGLPRPQGSLHPMRHRGSGKIVTFQPAKLRAWRDGVSFAARLHYHAEPHGGPVALLLDFTLARGKTVTRELPSVPPDLDKLIRAVGDSLSGTILVDDAQAVRIEATKSYGERPGVHVRVLALEATP
jgi:Holliday junction resolvase RusA-like endonuclease